MIAHLLRKLKPAKAEHVEHAYAGRHHDDLRHHGKVEAGWNPLSSHVRAGIIDQVRRSLGMPTVADVARGTAHIRRVWTADPLPFRPIDGQRSRLRVPAYV
jgi:hypothetical protein